MNLEYLPDSADGPVLLFHGEDPEGAVTLIRAFEALASGDLSKVALHELPGIEAVERCRVTAVVGSRSAGAHIAADQSIRWMLPSLRWDEIAGQVEPFASRAAASGAQFQYLSDEGPTTVIISTQRAW
jgi:hypothetical protein